MNICVCYVEGSDEGDWLGVEANIKLRPTFVCADRCLSSSTPFDGSPSCPVSFIEKHTIIFSTMALLCQ